MHRLLALHLGDEESPTTTLLRRLRACRIVAVSCAFSVATYGLFISAVVSVNPLAASEGPASAGLRWLLYGLALVGQLACFVAVRVVPAPAMPVACVASRLQARTVLRMAFSEIPAVFGLLLFLLRRTPVDFALLGTLSLVLIALRWPSTREWESAARDAGLRVQLDC